MKITAAIHDSSKDAPTTQKIALVYSPAADWAKPTGTKPTAVTMVPDSMGKAVEE